MPYFLTCVEKRSVTRERQSQMTLTFLFAEMPVDYSVKWRMRDRQERKQRERQRRGKKQPKNQNRIILRGKQTIWISTDIPKNIFSCIYRQVFVTVAVRSSSMTLGLVFIAWLNELWVILQNVWSSYMNTVCVFLLEGRGEVAVGSLTQTSTPLNRLLLGCLSPLTCPVARSLKTGTG